MSNKERTVTYLDSESIKIIDRAANSLEVSRSELISVLVQSVLSDDDLRAKALEKYAAKFARKLRIELMNSIYSNKRKNR